MTEPRPPEPGAPSLGLPGVEATVPRFAGFGSGSAVSGFAGAEAGGRDVQQDVCWFLEEAGIEWELGGRAGELIVTLPGEKKLKTLCSVVVGENSLSITAFVVRNPDENHEAVYAYLLRRNLRLPGLAYAIDKSGDVFVTGRVPLGAANAAYLDQIFGVVLEAADGAFNELLALGFLESMKKEWAWRTSRGESTRNLDAFRHLLEPDPGAETPSP